jgi:hypothetical protein
MHRYDLNLTSDITASNFVRPVNSRQTQHKINELEPTSLTYLIILIRLRLIYIILYLWFNTTPTSTLIANLPPIQSKWKNSLFRYETRAKLPGDLHETHGSSRNSRIPIHNSAFTLTVVSIYGRIQSPPYVVIFRRLRWNYIQFSDEIDDDTRKRPKISQTSPHTVHVTTLTFSAYYLNIHFLFKLFNH